MKRVLLAAVVLLTLPTCAPTAKPASPKLPKGIILENDLPGSLEICVEPEIRRDRPMMGYCIPLRELRKYLRGMRSAVLLPRLGIQPPLDPPDPTKDLGVIPFQN